MPAITTVCFTFSVALATGGSGLEVGGLAHSMDVLKTVGAQGVGWVPSEVLHTSGIAAPIHTFLF